LINYSQWRIVSPESSLARLNGCDGYIAQVWTGTSRTPNQYRGRLKERTFETAFLEYGAMQNLVRSTGRTVWYLNDPIEDNPNHDWADYKRNWECTMVASLFQPEVWRFEVSPWPERVFGGTYPRSASPEDRKPIPQSYATELQTVINALNDLKQPRIEWDAGTGSLGVLVSDSLMFQRGEPASSDEHLGHFFGLAMPLLKRGVPVTPVQLENIVVPHYLDNFRVLLLTYQGMKPLDATVHQRLAEWVKAGGVLLLCDDDSDPFNSVREWWNSNGLNYKTPREHLFEQLGLAKDGRKAQSGGTEAQNWNYGRGNVIWLRKNPAALAASEKGDLQLLPVVKQAASRAGLTWRETNYLLLRRGPYITAAGLDESVPGEAKIVSGRFVNLFDPQLRVQREVRLEPGSRWFLRDLDANPSNEPELLASAGKALVTEKAPGSLSFAVEGVGGTKAVCLLRSEKPMLSATLDGQALTDFEYSAAEKLLWVRFPNEAHPQTLRLKF
jgi:hypothetical protein